MQQQINIRGAGSKKSPAPRAAVIAADSLDSTQYAKVLDLISEGEVEGLVNGYKSVFIDGTPLQNADGTYNFTGFFMDGRTGAVVQDHIPGFATTEALLESSIGEVKFGIPVTRQIIGQNYDACRIMVVIPRLSESVPSNGDVLGSSVTVKIEVQSSGGSYITVVAGDVIEGKCSSPFDREYRVELPGNGPWNIRVSKLSADSTQYIQRDLHWSMLTAIIDTKFSYPNSAIIGLTIDSSQFTSIPSRAYEMRGIRVRVPKNYFPATRTYNRNETTGAAMPTEQVWHGEFYTAWSDNPAWCFFDLLTSKRYGLGEFVTDNQVDTANLYTIARYCDQLVPDGFGGLEPRYACNLYLQTREDAYRVLSDMAGLFGGMLFWASGGISCTQDRPSDSVHQFTNANVIDGSFTYSGSSRSARHTTALISYNDPSEGYKRKVEYVEYEDGIKMYGVRQTEMVAIGCASRGQAHRMGKRILLTENSLTETVTFRTSLEHMRCYPGAVIKVVDNNRNFKRLGGRIVSATSMTVTLDSEVVMEPGVTYVLSVLLPEQLQNGNGDNLPTMEERGVLNPATVGTGPLNVTTLNLTVPLSQVPNPQSVWILDTSDVPARTWKVVSIKENDGLIFEILALQYDAAKFDAIDNNTKFEPSNVTPPAAVPANTLDAPQELDVTISQYIDQNGAYRPRINMHWIPVDSPYVSAYSVSYRHAGGSWRTMPDSVAPSVDLEDATPGSYEVNVAAISILGRVGNVATKTFTVPSIDPTSVYTATTVTLSKPWDGPDLEFQWTALARARGYKVRISAGATVIRTFEVADLRYTYRYAQMMADQSDLPARTLKLEVAGVAANGAVGEYGTVNATNAQMAEAPSPTVDSGVHAFSLSVPKPAKADYAGTIFWASQTAGFTASDANKIYAGPATNFMHVAEGNWYFRAAYYDLFGKDGISPSAIGTGSSFSAAGLPSVDTLPSDPSEVGGQNVVYFTGDKKLYRWNGLIYTRQLDGGDLIPESILAEHIASIDLKAITASIGELETGKLKVDNTGYLRGGQSDFDTGSGFWLGYNAGAYKMSLANTLADSMIFDENGMTINGNLSIVSNASTPAVLNDSFDAGLLNWTPNVVTPEGSWGAASVDGRTCAQFTTPTTAGHTFEGYLYSDKFAVAAGQVFSSSITLKADAIPANSGLYISLECSNNAALTDPYISVGDSSVFISSQDIGTANEWITLALDGVVPADARFASLVIYYWGQV